MAQQRSPLKNIGRDDMRRLSGRLADSICLNWLVFTLVLVVACLVSPVWADENRPCGKYGGVLRTHAGEDLVHFDPHLQTTVRTQQRVGGSYNRLFRYSFYTKGEVVPDLVEKSEVSADGKTYTFKLHSGVKFHC